MINRHKLIFIIGLITSLLTVLTIILLTIFCFRRRKSRYSSRDIESVLECKEGYGVEDLMRFEGGEDLSVEEILDAPGEVVGKSRYGSLYRASLVNSSPVALLRFLKPSCTLGIKEVVPLVELVGSIRHPCLVPLIAFYRGPKGEKLMIHPFYGTPNLAQFIKDGKSEAHKWSIIHKISIGIAKGVGHLHSKQIVHGNLKSKNVLLDRRHRPYVSDFGIHLMLNTRAGQQMLQASASQGYKAPEIIKIKDASKESDVYSLGVILLELLSGKLSTCDEEFHLSGSLSVDDRTRELYDREIIVGQSENEKVVTEKDILRFLQLGMACCSPSPHLRPNIDQIIEKLNEIGK